MPWKAPVQPKCARCEKSVYPTEKLDCLDQVTLTSSPRPALHPSRRSLLWFILGVFVLTLCAPSGQPFSLSQQLWHKACFSCDVCGLKLTMNTYKGFDKRPYCNA